ncbi:MAG: metal-dependent hydrolase [Myxococcales bacterium]
MPTKQLVQVASRLVSRLAGSNGRRVDRPSEQLPGRGASTPEGVRVTYRKMEFEFESRGFERRWHSDSTFISGFWNALSSAFPAGERFFIDAANSVRDRIDDPVLREELSEFLRQESHHIVQHKKFNRMVAEQGFDMKTYEARYAIPLQAAAAQLKPMQKMAVTVALEHFTAVFAHQVLTNPAVIGGADPCVLALWSWHFMEELEHKATCFEAYERLGGSYVTRVKAAGPAWQLYLLLAVRSALSMLREDGRSLDPREYARGLWYLFGPSGFVTSMIPGLLDYFRPDFHPWQFDDSNLIANWQLRNNPHVRSMQVFSRQPEVQTASA